MFLVVVWTDAFSEEVAKTVTVISTVNDISWCE